LQRLQTPLRLFRHRRKKVDKGKGLLLAREAPLLPFAPCGTEAGGGFGTGCGLLCFSGLYSF